jgi:hypothetical protein
MPNYLNRFGVVCDAKTDRRILPETELWTGVILQAIDDLDRRTSSTPSSAQDSAREWFASESDAVGSFVWSCNVIDVDPHFVRSRLAKKHRRKSPVEVVMTLRKQRMKISREKGFPTFTGEGRSRLSRSQLSKRVVLGL